MSGNKGDQALAAVQRTLKSPESKARATVPVTLEEQQKHVRELLEKDKERAMKLKEQQRLLDKNPVQRISFYNPQRRAEQDAYLKAKAAGEKATKPFQEGKEKKKKSKTFED